MLANAKLGERAATLAEGVNHLVTPLAKRVGADEVLASVRKQGTDILTAYARALSEAAEPILLAGFKDAPRTALRDLDGGAPPAPPEGAVALCRQRAARGWEDGEEA